MKKAPREFIKNEFFKEFGSSAGRYLRVEEYKKNYYVVDDDNAYVAGKELKGYIGDILYIQYDGIKYGTGNYYLKSDRHGIVCKWKDEEGT